MQKAHNMFNQKLVAVALVEKIYCMSFLKIHSAKKEEEKREREINQN